MKTIQFMQTPLDTITLAEESGALTELWFGRITPEGARQQSTPLLRKAQAELAEYFSGKRKVFTVPLAPRGTVFQQSVWQVLRSIPYGETLSYGEVAKRIGNPKASRAVGMANNKNPLPILIPCHRVIGASGKLVGYGGGLGIKEALLTLEQQH
ncbi:MAG TPA: methylated-DNA--[protein]-cysteine S-methyltransferase [Candidatus Limiplasma sp.]|nr:methylated-DNA--[protein]-cysteine S-methyltransferase [Candidatus Limiplasma sp.]